LTKLGWTARTDLREGIAAAYRDFLEGGVRSPDLDGIPVSGEGG
jgi:hypothetical protein